MPRPSSGRRVRRADADREPFPERGDETFELMALAFNVSAASRLLAAQADAGQGRAPVPLSSGPAPMVVIDEAYAAGPSCDPSRPGILVTLPGGCGHLLIDGNHRAWRARRDGIAFTAWVLTETESRAVCYTRDVWARLEAAGPRAGTPRERPARGGAGVRRP